MSRSLNTCLLDTCVLFSHTGRDLFLFLAQQGIVEVKWSEHIFEEWRRNVKTEHLEKVNRTIDEMNLEYPTSKVHFYEHLIPEIRLYDKDDRHVVAAGIVGKANHIITFNTKDFPFGKLVDFELEAHQPDLYVVGLLKQYEHLSNLIQQNFEEEDLFRSRFYKTVKRVFV